MTIKEAIKHCKEKANGCSKCANEHAQLAEWLEELVKLRENQLRMKRELKSLDGITEMCDKLEQALELEAQNIDCDHCFVECDGIPDDNCDKRIAQYFKYKAGIDVEENDND